MPRVSDKASYLNASSRNEVSLIFNRFNQNDGRKTVFTKPFSEIVFDDIKAFCEKCPEGVRAEYKRQVHKEIPKSVSSFANTLGGILIFGVETDENNRAILPVEGMQSDRGMQERIEESAFDGIHPPVTPEVKVVDVPEIPGNVVVLVRVNESPEAPHAIQNSTRVYIRVGSTTQPYEKPELATIDRIEYMLKRREKPQELSNRIINRIEERITDYWSLTSQPVPNLTLIARPLFPYRPLISPSEIYEYMRKQSSNPRSRVLFNDHSADFGARQVSGGVCFVGASIPYQELNEYGIIYFREKLHKSLCEDAGIEYLDFRDLLRNHFDLIDVAKDFYQRCQYLGGIEIKAIMRDVRGERLMFGNTFRYDSIPLQKSLDSEISAAITCCARDLMKSENASNVIVNSLSQLLWGFGVRPGNWEGRARKMLEKWRVNG